MREKKDLKLVNIYFRIHNGQVITMDDLAYLAKYNPVCFKKTCDNLIYKKQEKKVPAKAPEKTLEKTLVTRVRRTTSARAGRSSFEAAAEDRLQNERAIKQIMESFKKIEADEFSNVSALQNIDLFQVKQLLGDLFEESSFPHNGVQAYFNAVESGSGFNVAV